jgi:ABC-2 type transport system permease protein
MKTNPLRIIFVTAWKDLQILLKDMGFLVVIILLPVIFSILMGTINQRAINDSKKSITFPVALVNQDSGAYGAQIVKILEDIDALELTILAAPEDARQQVLDSKVVAAVVIPPDLSQNVDTYAPSQVLVLVDRTQQEYGRIVTGIMKEVVSPIVLVGELSYGIRALLSEYEPYQQADEASKRGFVAQSLAANMAQVQKMQADPWVKLQAKTSEGKDLVIVPDNIFTMVVPSFCVLFAFFIVGALGGEVLRERQEGTLRRLMAAPLPRWAIILGKMLAFLLIVILQVTLIFGGANIIFDMPLGNSFLGLALLTVAMGLSATGLGMLVASVSKTDRQADTTGTLLGFIMAGLGGCFTFGAVPLYKGGGMMETISRFIPQGQALIGYDILLIQNKGLVEVLPHVGALTLMALIFFLFAVWRFRFEQ